MGRIKKIAGILEGVHIETIKLDEPFLNVAARFAAMPGTVLQMSGGDLDCSRYHILAAKPWLTFTVRGRQITIKVCDQILLFEADPFDVLRKLLKMFHFNESELPVPVASGLFGYLAYDLKDHLEKLPRTSIDDLRLPQICLFAPSVIIVKDKKKDLTFLCIPKRVVANHSSLENDLAFFQKIMTTAPPAIKRWNGNPDELKSGFTRAGYMDAIETIREYIASGHVYQVNLAQRFEAGFSGNPFSLFQTLYQDNPASFFAYIQAGDHQIVSTSPERFIKRTGNHVETRPIKGTIPRGKTLKEDKQLRQELLRSKKDDSELSMIVDLLRNDIGKVCAGGSVRVAEHKRLEAYKNVCHLVSIVEGRLDNNRDSVDLITAVFPGGSITGCPKIRAMEIIDELEPVRRHIYTGAIGYISFHDTLDLSIAIRTATLYNSKIIFSVGGGIVFDSDPAKEFDETLHKGRTLMAAFNEKEKSAANKKFIWINGKVEPQENAVIPITDHGFQYGYGFFETIRTDNGRPLYLKEHMQRFNAAWKQLFFEEPLDLTWEEIIDQVLLKNNLHDKTASIKIIASKANRETPPCNHSVMVMAKPYKHRLKVLNAPGLKLATYPEPRLTPLANYKTLNYLYYFLAGKWAKSQGADEALILNPDGTVSETNTANILLITNKTAIAPASPAVLPGIMEQVVLRLLDTWNFVIEKKEVRPEELLAAERVILTNSLIGAVPVIQLDEKNLPESSHLCQKINSAVLFRQPACTSL